MDTLKAIETVYKDYKFRSRLEARWAVFFDALGIEWEYEKEGYDLGEAGYYLPDFYLPQYRFWVEIKGQEPTKEEIAKAAALRWLDCPVMLCVGLPDECNATLYAMDVTESSGGGSEFEVLWAICNQCRYPTVHRLDDGRRDRQIVDAAWNQVGYCVCDIVNQDIHSPLIYQAYRRAKQARFEHGEKG